MSKDKISFIDTLKQSFTVFNRKYYEILILASLPFLAYALMYIYSGDFSVEAIANIPEQILYTIYFILFISYILIFPTAVSIAMGAIKEEQVTLRSEIKRIFKKTPSLLSGFFIIALFGFLFIMAFLLIISFLDSTTFIAITATVFAIIAIRLLIGIIFFTHGILFQNLRTFQSIKHSFKISNSNLWQVIKLYILLVLVSFILLNAISMGLSYIIPNNIVFFIVMAFIQSLSAIFTQVFSTVLYAYFTEINDDEII